MHEFSIASGLVEKLLDFAEKNPNKKIVEVRERLFRAVVPVELHGKPGRKASIGELPLFRLGAEEDVHG